LFSPSGINTILFDFDGTLRHNSPLASDFFTDYVLQQGHTVSHDDRLRGARWEHYYWASSSELQADLNLYKDESDAFWCQYAFRRLIVLGLDMVAAEEFAPDVCQYMTNSYKREDIVPAELPEVLGLFQKTGFRMGVVSNRDKPFWEELVTLDLCPFFEFSLAAGEVQSWKPNPGIFEAALERLTSSAEQTLYVGDNYFADVVGARRAGLQPVLYDPKGIFHDPGCPVITNFNDLQKVLETT
jgi:HAD superfamily hydrolase (TIGR01549 family)